MVAYNENAEQKLIEIKISGKFTKEDFQHVAKKLKPRMEQWDDIKILEVIEDLEGMEMGAVIEDMKFGFQNLGMIKKFKKCAIVADEKWVRTLSDLTDPFVKAEVESFHLTEKDQALQWLLH